MNTINPIVPSLTPVAIHPVLNGNAYRDERFDNAKWCCRYRECLCNPETDETSGIQTLTVPTVAPGTKYEATLFQQDFRLGNRLQLVDEELYAFERIYASYASEWISPLPSSEVESKIDTMLFVERVHYLDPKNVSVTLEYRLLIESQYYDVSRYYMLFQNWTEYHSDDILEDLQTLGGWNVTEVSNPVSISSMGGPGTVTSTRTNSSSIRGETSSSSSVNGLTIFLFAVAQIIVVALIIAVGVASIFFYYRKRFVDGSNHNTHQHNDHKPSHQTYNVAMAHSHERHDNY